MSSPKSILLRFESKDGQFRLTVKPTDQFTSLLSRVSPLLIKEILPLKAIMLIRLQQILENVPKNVDSRSITLSNKPFGGEDRLLSSLKNVAIDRVGLRYLLLPF